MKETRVVGRHGNYFDSSDQSAFSIHVTSQEHQTLLWHPRSQFAPLMAAKGGLAEREPSKRALGFF